MGQTPKSEILIRNLHVELSGKSYLGTSRSSPSARGSLEGGNEGSVKTGKIEADEILLRMNEKIKVNDGGDNGLAQRFPKKNALRECHQGGLDIVKTLRGRV